MRLKTMPHHQGREHGYRSTHDNRYTFPLRAHGRSVRCLSWPRPWSNSTRRSSQADGLPEVPDEPSVADEQPCGADQPAVPVPGEGAVPVAAADAGPVRGVGTGRDLEGMDSR